jgi:hypothetical protein
MPTVRLPPHRARRLNSRRTRSQPHGEEHLGLDELHQRNGESKSGTAPDMTARVRFAFGLAAGQDRPMDVVIAD